MVKNLPYRPAAWLLIGSAMHEAREQWELDLRGGDTMAARFEAAYDLMVEAAWVKQPDEKWWVKRPNVKNVSQDLKLYREHGGKQAAAYEEMCRQSDWKVWTTPDGEPALEIPFSLHFDASAKGFSKDVEVIGYVDLVKEWPNGLLTIEDMKTGNKVANNRQLGLYALAMNETFGTDIWKAEYWYTKTGESGGTVDTRRYTREYLTDQYGALDYGIEHRVFLINPGTHCGTCGVRPWCREFGALDEALPNPEAR